METKPGYEGMSPEGKAMCEFIELSERYVVQTMRAERNPALEGAPEMQKLRNDIRSRYTSFTDSEKAAADGFLSHPQSRESRYGMNWTVWLSVHLASNPQDAFLLQGLEQNFRRVISPDMVHQCCRDFTWRMHHEW